MAREVARAAERSQVSVVSHAAPLIETLGRQPGCHSITLDKTLGETRVAGSRELERPPWHCPGR